MEEDGIRGSADRSISRNVTCSASHPLIFEYIHSATAAKLWIYAYQRPPTNQAADRPQP